MCTEGIEGVLGSALAAADEEAVVGVGVGDLAGLVAAVVLKSGTIALAMDNLVGGGFIVANSFAFATATCKEAVSDALSGISDFFRSALMLVFEFVED